MPAIEKKLRNNIPSNSVIAAVTTAALLLTSAVAAVLLLAPIQMTSASNHSAWASSIDVPAVNGKIAFASNRDGNSEIYTANADGTDLTNVSNNPEADDINPSWSPDGTKLLFESGFPSRLFVVNADGTGLVSISYPDIIGEYHRCWIDEGSPPEQGYWSPDGTRILIDSTVGASGSGGSSAFYIVNADGMDMTVLTNSCGIRDFFIPKWSPDGAKIVFHKREPVNDGSSSSSGGKEVWNTYIANSDGTNAVNISANLELGFEFSGWSPDSKMAVFTRLGIVGGPSGNLDAEIFVGNPDGTGLINVSNMPDSSEFGPEWSPDGSKILFFSRDQDNRFSVYVVNPDGGGLLRAGEDLSDSSLPFLWWSPDGSAIAFEWNLDGDNDIYVANLIDNPSSGIFTLEDISDNTFNDRFVHWSPDGMKILFTSDTDNDFDVDELNVVDRHGDNKRNALEGLEGINVFFGFPFFGDPWSPDSSKIAFHNLGDPIHILRDIYVADLSSDSISLTNLSGDVDSLDTSPVWQPDSSDITPNIPPTHKQNGKIAFTSERDTVGFNTNREIYVMNPDGSEQTRLTNNTAFDDSPTWSPNGTKMAFLRDGTIHIMNADGSGQASLANGTVGAHGELAWSPDGAKIAYTGTYTLGRSSLLAVFVVNIDGTGLVRLTNVPTSNDSSPSWSPDSKRIVFTSSRDNEVSQSGFLASEIYVMNSDGTNQTRVTDNDLGDSGPDWSPDGSKIVFTRGDPGAEETMGFYTMNPDGTNQMRLADVSGGSSPSWSPDGTKISFISNKEGPLDEFGFPTLEIYAMDADGTGQIRLTFNEVIDYGPEWGAQPDGTGQPPAPPSDDKDMFCGRLESEYDNVLFGTNAAETLTGTENDDLIRGWGGNDTIYGLAGNDCLKGDDGDDQIWGGNGNDGVRGGDGEDRLHGDAGNDIVNGHAGDDKGWGGDGGDILLGETGIDLLIGDSGNDTMWGGNDDDRILGEDGNDIAYGDMGNDRIYGQEGDDLAAGGSGDDIIVGGNGMDKLIGDAGNDRMWGSADNDTLYDDEGDDYHNGGSETDKCYDIVGTNVVINCEE